MVSSTYDPGYKEVNRFLPLVGVLLPPHGRLASFELIRRRQGTLSRLFHVKKLQN